MFILVNLGDKPSEMAKSCSNVSVTAIDPPASQREHCTGENKEAAMRTRNNVVADGLSSKVNSRPLSPPKRLGKESRKSLDNPGSDRDSRALKTVPSPKKLLHDAPKIVLDKNVKGRETDGSEKRTELPQDNSDSFPTEVIYILPKLPVNLLYFSMIFLI